MQTIIRLLCAALLGVTAAVLVSCGGSGSGLIPSANAGPLRGDFEAVSRAASAGNGSCASTESALGKTEQDFLALPSTVNGGLRARLEQGISNLRKVALAVCLQASPTATSTTGAETTPSTTASTATTETTPPTATTTSTGAQTTPTTTSPGQSGGTEASGEGAGEEGQAKGKGKGKDKSEGEGNGNGAGLGAGGAGVGGASPGGGQ
jgi:hypothetical protein